MPGDAANRALARNPSTLTVALGILSSALLVLYPVIVYFAFDRLGVRGAALLMLAALSPALLARLRRTTDQRVGTVAMVPVVTVALLATGAALEAAALVLAVPTAVNVLLFASFAPTLVSGPPMIERFARLTHPDLTEPEIVWCRRWTVVWSVFFVLNALTAALLAAFAPIAMWVFHTSILGYVLMGLLLGTEWVVRKLRFKRFGRGPVDRMLERLARSGDA
jgi:uncharacterized membrane protein